METVWLLLALVCGLIAQFFRIPILIGYLAAGLVLSLFEVQQSPTLDLFADLGLSLLLFTVGLHLRAKSFFRPEVLGSALIHLSISTLFFALVFLLMTGEPALTLACAFGFSSTVVTVSALDRKRELDSFVGRLALGVLVIQDIVSVALIAGDAGYRLSFQALWLLFLVPGAFVLRLVLSRVSSRELFLLFGFGYALIIDDLFVHLGLSGHLGALIAGVTLAGHDASESLAKELWGIKELFLLALFLSIGLYGLPPASSLPLICVLLASLPLKGILFFFIFVFLRLRARTAFVSALSLCAYSEFTLVVAFYLARNGTIPAEFVSAAAVTAAISFALCSFLMTRSNFLWDTYGSSLSRFQRPGHLVDRRPVSLGKSNVLIIGMGVAGVAAYERALEMGYRPVGIERDPARIADRLQDEQRVIHADCLDSSFWSELDLSGVQSIILAIPDLPGKLETLDQLERLHFSKPIVALARDTKAVEALKARGIAVSVIPMVEVGRELAEQISA